MKNQNLILKAILQKLGRTFIGRIINTYIAKINQKEISKISKDRQLIFLKPFPLNTGNVEHYYHFLFDLILPLSISIKNSSENSTFLIEEFGIYTDRVDRIFSNRTRIIKSCETSTSNIHSCTLIGLSPRHVLLTHRSLQTFCEDICQRLQIKPVAHANKILLVERLPPDSYFLDNAVIKGSGTARRSIINHQDLRNTIASRVKAPFEFQNVQLEKMPFSEQVDVFSKACVVFAQHGAGLANCVWMNPESIVIEFSHKQSQNHFKIISDLKKHDYYLYKTFDAHANIDIDVFTTWVLSQAKLKKFFSEPSEND